MKKIIYTTLLLFSLSLQAKDANFFVTNDTNTPLYVQASKTPTDDPLIFKDYIQPHEKRKITFQVDDVFFPPTYLEIFTANHQSIIKDIGDCIFANYYVYQQQNTYRVLYNCAA